MKALITGINGFAASHLADHLIENGVEVIGTHRIRYQKENIEHLKVKLYPMELNDPYGVESVVKSVRPDVVFHLAAQSFVGWSWDHPVETLQANVIGTVHLLEAVRKHVPGCYFQVASSSQVYGKVSELDMPMGKLTHFSPMNPYDTSKLAQDMLCLQYFNSYKLNIVRTRAFNISGPRRGESFAESSWAKQIALIEAGKQEPVIYHGNLDSERDYIDVRDTVKAYVKAAIFGKPGEVYIIGSGIPRSMRSILMTLLEHTDRDIELKQDAKRMRPSDTTTMRADTSDMNWLLNDQAIIPFEQTMLDLLNYWRERVRV